MIEERWPEKRGLVEEPDAYESQEGVYSFESGQNTRPGHDVDGGRDSVTLDRRQREKHRGVGRRIDPGNELHARFQEVE